MIARCREEGISAGEYPTMVDADVVVVWCQDETGWVQLSEVLQDGPAVALLGDFALSDYLRAIVLGAAVVYIDTSTEIILLVARAAASGEVVLPVGVAQAIAARAEDSAFVGLLTHAEQEIATLLQEGRTNTEIASRLNYSDRTVRRRIQTLYVKIGARSRVEARELLAGRGPAIPKD